MGRASKEEAQRTRARIVEKAAELFRAFGVDAVSVADVMGALGLTVGGFYKHFASKDALVAEAMSLAFEQADASWAAVPDTVPLALVEHYLKNKPAHQTCPMVAFAAHVARGEDHAARSAYVEGVERLLQRFTAAPLSNAKEASENDVMLMFAAMVGARVLSRAAGDTGWAEALNDAVMDAVRCRS